MGGRYLEKLRRKKKLWDIRLQNLIPNITIFSIELKNCEKIIRKIEVLSIAFIRTSIKKMLIIKSLKNMYRLSGWLCTRGGEIVHSLNFKYLLFFRNTEHRLLKSGSEKNGTTQHSQGQTHRRRTIYFHKAHQQTIVLKTFFIRVISNPTNCCALLRNTLLYKTHNSTQDLQWLL